MEIGSDGRIIKPRRGWKADSRLIPGLVIALLGVLLMLHNLGVLEIERLWRFWPLILISFGLHRLLEQPARRRGFGFALLVIGIAFQLHYFGWMPLNLGHLEQYWHGWSGLPSTFVGRPMWLSTRRPMASPFNGMVVAKKRGLPGTIHSGELAKGTIFSSGWRVQAPRPATASDAPIRRRKSRRGTPSASKRAACDGNSRRR